MATKKFKEPMQQATTAHAYLKKLFRGKNKDVWVDVVHVARSRQMRILEIYVIRNNVPIDITDEVARVTGLVNNLEKGGIVFHGVGLNVPLAVVQKLAHELYGGDFENYAHRLNLRTRA